MRPDSVGVSIRPAGYSTSELTVRSSSSAPQARVSRCPDGVRGRLDTPSGLLDDRATRSSSSAPQARVSRCPTHFAGVSIRPPGYSTNGRRQSRYALWATRRARWGRASAPPYGWRRVASCTSPTSSSMMSSRKSAPAWPPSRRIPGRRGAGAAHGGKGILDVGRTTNRDELADAPRRHRPVVLVVVEVEHVLQVQVAGRLAPLIDQHVAGESALRDRALDIRGGRILGKGHQLRQTDRDIRDPLGRELEGRVQGAGRSVSRPSRVDCATMFATSSTV